MKYWTEKEYKDERGAIVTLRITMDTDDSSVYEEKYYGKGMTVINSPMGEIPHEFEVELDADNACQAFTVFEDEMTAKAPAVAKETAEEVMEQIKQQMQEQQNSIITPDQFNPNVRG